LVYLKIENISLYFYFLAYFSKLPFVGPATTGASTTFISQKTATALVGSSESYNPKPKHQLCLNTGTAGEGQMQSQHSLRRVWFYCEVNHMNREWRKKVFSRNRNLTLSSLKAIVRDWEAFCVGLSPGYSTLTWAAT